jgi:ectoine hydroxylase-related dioxygenase (phytanoyl-CoA dioxygenase family)
VQLQFSQAEIQQFLNDGFVMLRGGFSRELAERGREYVWAKTGLSVDDPSKWTESMIHIQEAFRDGPFGEIVNDKIVAAVDELAGEGRAYVHDFFGWWPVLFPGFEGPGGWHVDGSNFHHRLESKEQALVTLYLFSDIGPGDGGTAIFPGSHHSVARILHAAEPEGLLLDELIGQLPAVDPEWSVEVTGQAGDIAFLHPFLIHGFSANQGSNVRIACNPQYPFKTEMNLNRESGEHSPVEEAIRIALGDLISS